LTGERVWTAQNRPLPRATQEADEPRSIWQQLALARERARAESIDCHPLAGCPDGVESRGYLRVEMTEDEGEFLVTGKLQHTLCSSGDPILYRKFTPAISV
jgi:hypothetical protein